MVCIGLVDRLEKYFRLVGEAGDMLGGGGNVSGMRGNGGGVVCDGFSVSTNGGFLVEEALVECRV